MRKVVLLLTPTLLPLIGAEWNRDGAFAFLETRQQQWADWKPAQKPGGPCISCHTGLPYLIARNALASPLPARFQQDLVQSTSVRVLAEPPHSMGFDDGAQAVLNLWTLSMARAKADAPPGKADQAALAMLWKKQIRKGVVKGSWTWVLAGLEPWDSEHANYFGTALAVRALRAYPESAATGIAEARSYLEKEAPRQPLHNRMAWIAFSPTVKRTRDLVLADLWTAQAEDGGWSTASLGPWMERPSAPPDSGSNAYATAWAAYTAREAGVPCADPRLARAIQWLMQAQNRQTGAWHSVSMNKAYPAGSEPALFMTDAATGFAVAALLSCGK
ncbi:MAG: hypothetical protein JNL98_37305 [Bryobacterales bacterium]|nr:hypothetical protein [Bryobacterales bacterium]